MRPERWVAYLLAADIVSGPLPIRLREVNQLVLSTPNVFSISWVRFLDACFGFCHGVMVAGMSDYRHKRHNVSSLLSHSVWPAQYRRVIFDTEVAPVLRDSGFDIAQRYAIAFWEIGPEKDPVHFLVQSVPS